MCLLGSTESALYKLDEEGVVGVKRHGIWTNHYVMPEALKKPAKQSCQRPTRFVTASATVRLAHARVAGAAPASVCRCGRLDDPLGHTRAGRRLSLKAQEGGSRRGRLLMGGQERGRGALTVWPRWGAD